MNAHASFDFSGSGVVVTGGASGIGAACARRFAASGAAVALWDVDAAAGTRLVDELEAGGRRAAFFACDVASAADVAAACTASLAALGRIDVLVNNAGTFHSAEFLDIAEADWDRVLDVNLKGAFLVAQSVARTMVEAARGGAIVNMSSVNGMTAIPTLASYNASKGAILQLTRAMALSLADHGIRVNAVAPGTIATDLARRAVLDSADAEARIMSRTPMRRMGEPDEVAAVCLFLASDAASYLTGETVVVDGGRMALNYTVAPKGS